LKKIISSVFFHELKNSLSSIRFSIEVFNKYEMSEEEKKQSINEVLNTIDNTVDILEEYMEFMKFQFTKKLPYEDVNIYEVLEEIQKELTPFAQEKNVRIYIRKSDITVYTNKFWLKRAIYNIVYNAIKFNKEYGSVNIKLENSTFGTYISISDTGIGVSNKSIKSIFKLFKTVDETRQGVGVGLALAKSVLQTLGGDIHVESSENVGSDFVLYIPHNPKEITIKRLALALIPASLILFLGISYFPIYSQKVVKNVGGGYITYKFEDGSVLKFSKNSKYELKAYKNLYNTKYVLTSYIKKGDFSLKAIKNKASIYVDDREFNNLGTDFEIIKDKYTKLAVFNGAVKSDALVLDKGQGSVIDDKIKVIKLLPPPKYVTVNNRFLTFRASPESLKYRVLISTDKDFSKIENSFFTTKSRIKLNLSKDTLYYIKVFQYDKYELPSLPSVTKYVNLVHYHKAKKALKVDINEAILELQNSISTIKDYSSLPYFELAQIYYKQKHYEKSLLYIKKAIQIDAKKEYYYLMFDSYHKLKQDNEIEKYLSKVLKKYPNDIKFLFYKAQMLYKNHKYTKVNQILFKILQKNPNYREANLLMSKVLYKLGKKERAHYYERLAK